MIVRRYNLPMLVAVALINLWPALLHAQDPPVAWKFAVGDVHHYRLNQQMKMTMALLKMGTVESTIGQSIDMVWRVTAVDDAGSATIEQRITGVRFDMQAPGKMELHYDSADDEDPSGFAAMLAPALKALQSGVVTMTLSRRGEITSMDVPEPVVAAMRGMPGGGLLGDLATPNGFKQTIQSNLLVLPAAEDLKPDFEWTTSTETNNPELGTVTTSTAYRYEGPRDTEGELLAAFVFSAEVKFNDLPEGVSINEDGQETEGLVMFDPQHGRQQSSKLRQQTDWIIAIGGRPVCEQEMDQTVELLRVKNDE